LPHSIRRAGYEAKNEYVEIAFHLKLFYAEDGDKITKKNAIAQAASAQMREKTLFFTDYPQFACVNRFFFVILREFS